MLDKKQHCTVCDELIQSNDNNLIKNCYYCKFITCNACYIICSICNKLVCHNCCSTYCPCYEYKNT